MLTDDLETKIILLAFLIDIPCIGWLLNQYITNKEATAYWITIITIGIVIYSIWTIIENPYIEFGMETTDIYGARTYLPLSKIAVSISPGIIVITIIKNIQNIKSEILFFKNYGNWNKDFQPKLVTKIILLIRSF